MKRIVTILIISFGINITINAQFDKHKVIYPSVELSLGNYVGIDMNVNYVYKQKYSFKAGYSGNIRRAKSRPADYSPGFLEVLTLGLANPYDQLENYQIGVGRIYNLNKRGTIRLNASIGLGHTTIREPENWKMFYGQIATTGYTWNYNSYKTLSLIINPKIEFPFTRVYGLTVSPMIQINKDRTYFGAGIGGMLRL